MISPDLQSRAGNAILLVPGCWWESHVGQEALHRVHLKETKLYWSFTSREWCPLLSPVRRSPVLCGRWGVPWKEEAEHMAGLTLPHICFQQIVTQWSRFTDTAHLGGWGVFVYLCVTQKSIDCKWIASWILTTPAQPPHPCAATLQIGIQSMSSPCKPRPAALYPWIHAGGLPLGLVSFTRYVCETGLCSVQLEFVRSHCSEIVYRASGHLDCFQFLSIRNSNIKNMPGHVLLYT